MAVRIICESAELAVECARAAEQLGLSVEPELAASWSSAALAALSPEPLGVALVEPPSLEQLVVFADRARQARSVAVLAMVGNATADVERIRGVAGDLGVTAVAEVEPLLCALQLARLEVARPWTASARGLSRTDRVRLQAALEPSTKGSGQLVRAEDTLLAYREDDRARAHLLGRPRDVASALAALRDTDRDSVQVESSVEDVDVRAVIDVLFGPRRSLSDPTSKAALLPYGIPLPVEELCASPSRAAAEASRIGYPVRISLASPDLRVWDHPDLAVDMVDNAARVRETFRQLMGVANARLQDHALSERLLGVMVTATSEPAALLGVRAWPIAADRVAMEIAFADAHGRAADDRSLAVLPAPLSVIERALRRLRGSALLLHGTPGQRKAQLEALGDVLLRLSAFVHDRRQEVELVELRPAALLIDGTVEVREACVTVSDAFERSLSSPPPSSALGR